MKKFFKILTGSMAVLSAAVLVSVGTADYFTPDRYTVVAGGSPGLNNGVLSVQPDEKDRTVNAFHVPDRSTTAQLMLFGAVPVKDVQVNTIKEASVIPCGTPFGVKMFTNGVMIVGVADIDCADKTVNPAAAAGLKVGDIIQTINGKEVNSNEEIAELVKQSGGAVMKVVVKRSSKELSVQLQPVKAAADGAYKAGLWVRDSTAGIGTLTFYNPETGGFGGLGHGICDMDTSELMPLRDGDIVPVIINGVTKGRQGVPGELHGYFSSDTAMGSLCANVTAGVYGSMFSAQQGQAVPVAMKQEVKKGKAQILSTIDGGSPQYYEVQIDSVNYRGNGTKNMVVRITDQKLLETAGGIVQGMSGSPILQNGKLVGAVTHVFINDPTRGYGIFAENMLETAEGVMAPPVQKAS